MPEDEEEVVGERGDGVKREEARSRDDARERERETRQRERKRKTERVRVRRGQAKRKGAGERKRGIDGCSRKAVGVEVTGLWSRRDVASVRGEKRRWRRTAVSRPRGK